MTGKQLKNAILQLAIQGRLVAQDPDDEPASVLLAKIRAEKEQRAKEGKLKKKDLISKPITDEEKPFDIPKGWEWCRLGEVSNYAITKKKINAAQANKTLWGLDLEDIQKGGRLLRRKTIGESNSIGDKTYFQKGNILYSKLRPYLLKVLIAHEDGVCSPEIIPFNCYGYINHNYIVYVLKSIYIDEYINNATFGVKMPRVSTETMINLLIPLPPLAEQRRIVAKIEELMPLVEEYDKAQTQLDALEAKLPERLKKSILQEAIQGRLVAQDPDDEPASVLLAKIRAEKEQRVKEGKLKKKDLISKPITDEEKPFDIPKGWEWCRLEDIVSFLNGYAFKSNKYVDKGIRIIRITNVQEGYMEDPEPKYYSKDPAVDWEKYELFEGDMLMSLTGNVGRVAFLPKEMLPAALNQRVACIRRKSAYYDEKFLFRYFSSPHFIKTIISSSKGMAQKNASTEWLKQSIFPLPPLAEQRRIVAKIDELFNLLS